MFDIVKYKSILNEYIKIENDPYSDIEFVEIRDELKNLICKDDESFNGFVRHLLNDDIAIDEFIAIAEVSDEVAEKRFSKEYIKALKKLRMQYSEETEKYKLTSFLDSAKSITEYNLKKQKEEKE